MNEIHALGALLQESMDRNGWSLRALSARAESRGFKMSHSNFGRLKDEPVVSMKGETIKMLAQVLQVPQARIVAAVLESMDIDMPNDQVPQTLPDFVRSSSELSTRDQRILLSVIDVMRDDESGEKSGSPQPGKPEPSAPRLRAVDADSDHPGTKQKTTSEGSSITEIHGADTAKYPVPPIEQLAAHPYFETEQEKFDRHLGERGEENQDPDDADHP